MVKPDIAAAGSNAGRLNEAELADERLAFLRCASWFPELAERLEADGDALYQDFREAARDTGAEPMDYLKYRFYEKSPAERDAFVTRAQYEGYCASFNRPFGELLLGDRSTFSAAFEPWLGRRVVTLGVGQRSAFDSLLDECGTLLLKPREGGYGSGMRLVQADEDRDAVWRAGLEDRCVAEELIRQDDAMAVFHPESVNTLRMMVARRPSGRPVLYGAVLRCGCGGAFTDNDWGVFAGVDVATGRVGTVARDHFNREFPVHPDTGVAFVGAQVPAWRQLKKRALQAAAVLDGLRLANWDWAFSATAGWCLVEGNVNGGFGPVQEVWQRGLRDELEGALFGRGQGAHEGLAHLHAVEGRSHDKDDAAGSFGGGAPCPA